MATVTPPADQAADLLQKLSLDSQTKSLEIPEPIKKTAVYHYGVVDSNGQPPSFDRSLTPLLPSDALDPSVCFIPNGYQPYYFGGYGNGLEWNESTGYTNPDGVDLSSGIYGENGSLVYPQGYAYAAYAYSPATSPAPAVGSDGQLYAAELYQYPYFPLPTSSGPFTSSVAAPSQGDISTIRVADEKALPAGGTNAADAAAGVSKSGTAKGNNGSAPVKPLNQGTLNPSANLYGNSAQGGGFAAGYQDPSFSYDGFYTPVSWHDGSKFSDVQRPVSGSGVASSFSKANNVPSSRNQNYQSNSHYAGLHQPASMAGFGTAQGCYNGMYQSKLYSQYGSISRSGMVYGSSGYGSRTNGRWVAADNKYRGWGKGNNYFYGRENIDGLNELNRGPRAKGPKNQKGTSETGSVVKGQTGTSNLSGAEDGNKTCVVPEREQYNREDFREDYTDAKFYVIKSYSEDDIHKSIKYNVWASTPNGNKKLDAAYQEAQQKAGRCPVFLFFSVNASGQFVGLAEMIGPVDFNKNVEYWQQDKWTGSFHLKWHIVKDVPNSLLKHITLENNENKPVTNSRDTQEVKLEQGLKIIKIFKEHNNKTCILDDFSFYEVRQKTIQEKKAKQQQHLQTPQKQVWEGKTTDDKKEPATSGSASAVQGDGGHKVAENGSTAKTRDPLTIAKQVGSLPNGC